MEKETKEKQLVKFTDILAQVSKSGRALNDHRKRTFDWYQSKAKQIRSIARNIDPNLVDPKTLMTAKPENIVKKSTLAEKMIGKMIMYYYDPKHKKTLPYYDIFS